jgi:hypothetical protein
MSTHASPATTEPKGPKRLKPHQLVIGIGCGIGLFTLVSGIVPMITGWHSDSEITRKVFEGLPVDEWSGFLGLVGIFDVMALAAGIGLFGALVDE